MLATAVSGALAGIDGLLVEVEVDVALGLLHQVGDSWKHI